jgi:hypothetical protein
MSVNCASTCHNWLTEQPDVRAMFPGYGEVWARTHGCKPALGGVDPPSTTDLLTMVGALRARHSSRIELLREAHKNDAQRSEEEVETDHVALESTDYFEYGDDVDTDAPRVIFMVSPVHTNAAPTQLADSGAASKPSKYVNIYYESTHEIASYHFRAHSPGDDSFIRSAPIITGGHAGATEAAGFLIAANKRLRQKGTYVAATSRGNNVIPANDAARPRFLTQLRLEADYNFPRICPDDLNVLTRDHNGQFLAIEDVAFDDATYRACAHLHGHERVQHSEV